MGAHSGNTHKANPTEMPDTWFELHQTNFSAPPLPRWTPQPTDAGPSAESARAHNAVSPPPFTHSTQLALKPSGTRLTRTQCRMITFLVVDVSGGCTRISISHTPPPSWCGWSYNPFEFQGPGRRVRRQQTSS